MQAICEALGGKFSSTSWERSKKLAEQSAAAVCLFVNKAISEDGDIHISLGSNEHKEEASAN